MDKLKFGETAVLEDGRQYTCFANLKYQEKDYVFLISEFKPLQIRLAEQKIIDGDLQIKIVVDKELKYNLLNILKQRNGQLFKG